MLEKPLPGSVLEGTLVREAEGVLKVFLRTDGGQRCVLREDGEIQGDVHLRDIADGARIQVEGYLDSYLYEPEEMAEPAAVLRTWIIFMNVKRVVLQTRHLPPVLPAEPLPREKDPD